MKSEEIIYIDQLLTIPPLRSQLYHLKPLGIGTSRVESLTSFISRLAEAHCVPVRKLMLLIILPLLGKSYLPSGTENSNTTAFWKDSSALNGTSTSAGEFVSILEQLTCHNSLRFLTMLTWAGVISCRYLLRRTKVWCPICFQEWLENGMPIYEPLLWSLGAITICLYHNHQLKKNCPYCKRDSSMLAPLIRPGHCPHCDTWLGILPVPPKKSASNDLLEDELKWQRYVIQTVGEMLAASPSLPSSPSRESFAQTIAGYLECFADGKVSVLAHKLHLSRRTIRDWKQGVQVPQLESLLRCCYALDTSPFDLFIDNTSANLDTHQTTSPVGIEIKGKIKKRYRVLDVEKIRKELEAELLVTEEPPSPMSAVARRLRYDHSYLRRHFPDLCRAISDRYRAYRKKKREERRHRILDEVRRTTYRVYKQGSYPSQERIRLLLAKPGSIKEPGALAVWHEALAELGLESKEP